MQFRKYVAAAAVLAGLAVPALSGVNAGASSMKAHVAKVTIVHAIPNTPVDVYLNGKKAVKDFTFGTVKTVSLAPGKYVIAIRPFGASTTSAPILGATETLKAGRTVSIVANLTAAPTPAPTLSVFVNPTSMLAMG